MIYFIKGLFIVVISVLKCFAFLPFSTLCLVYWPFYQIWHLGKYNEFDMNCNNKKPFTWIYELSPFTGNIF